MTIVKRSDVKNHIRPPFLAKILVVPPESQPDATGFSKPDSDAIDAGSSSFDSDFVAEHSSPAVASMPGHHLPGSFHLEAPTAPKSAKA